MKIFTEKYLHDWRQRIIRRAAIESWTQIKNIQDQHEDLDEVGLDEFLVRVSRNL